MKASEIRKFIAEGLEIPDELLLSVYDADGSLLMDLFALALELKEKYTGRRVNFCSIVSAKTGMCSEDCHFCGQSALVKKGDKIKVNPLMSESEIVEAAKKAKLEGANEFSIVTSGSSVNNRDELNVIASAIKRIRNEVGITPCASLGFMTFEDLLFLKENGLEVFHHNVETSAGFYPNICTTHKYSDNLDIIRNARKAGLKVCSGVIIGMGESRLDRIKMAKEIKELDVDNIPVNFLNPIKGTPLGELSELTPIECLKTLTIFRLVNPGKNILAQGGRERNLRQLQPLVLMSGANGMLLGNYLLTQGRQSYLDLELVEDLGFEKN